MMTAIDMPAIDFSFVFALFLLYAFVGWCCEEVWCTIGFKKLVKRGMLYGPICPIYGFGALLILYILYPWRTTYIRLFLASMVVTSILEYFSSWLLEKLFHAKWWDYSKNHFNLNGRVCLLNSVAFGIGGVALEHVMHPAAERLLALPLISDNISSISMVLALLLTGDVLMTLHNLVNFTATMAKLKLYGEQLHERFANESWFKGESLHAMVESIKAHATSEPNFFSKHFMTSLDAYTRRQQIVEFWIKKFPNLSSHDFASPLEHLKLLIKENRAKKNEAAQLTKSE